MPRRLIVSWVRDGVRWQPPEIRHHGARPDGGGGLALGFGNRLAGSAQGLFRPPDVPAVVVLCSGLRPTDGRGTVRPGRVSCDVPGTGYFGVEVGVSWAIGTLFGWSHPMAPGNLWLTDGPGGNRAFRRVLPNARAGGLMVR